MRGDLILPNVRLNATIVTSEPAVRLRTRSKSLSGKDAMADSIRFQANDQHNVVGHLTASVSASNTRLARSDVIGQPQISSTKPTLVSEDSRVSLLCLEHVLPSIFTDPKASGKMSKQGFQPVHKLLQRILSERDLAAFPEFADELLSMFPLFADPEEFFQRLAAMFDAVPSLVSKLSLTSMKTRVLHEKVLKRRTNIVDLVRRFVLYFATPLRVSDELLNEVRAWIIDVSRGDYFDNDDNDSDNNEERYYHHQQQPHHRHHHRQEHNNGRHASTSPHRLLPSAVCEDLVFAIDRTLVARQPAGTSSDKHVWPKLSRLLQPTEPLSVFDRLTAQTLSQQITSAFQDIFCTITVSELCAFVGVVRKHLHAPEMGLFGEAAQVKAQETVSTTATLRLVAYCNQLVMQHRGNFPRIQAHINFVTRLRNWVVSQILAQTDLTRRTRTLETWIRIAQLCLSSAVPECAAAIIDGLYHPSVERLQRTWRSVSSRMRSLFAEVSEEILARRKYSLLVVQSATRSNSKQVQEEWDLFRFTFQLASCVSDSSLFTSKSAEALGAHANNHRDLTDSSLEMSLVCLDFHRARSIIIRLRTLQTSARAALSTMCESSSGENLNLLPSRSAESTNKHSFLSSARQMMSTSQRVRSRDADSPSTGGGLTHSLSASSTALVFTMIGPSLDAPVAPPPQVQYVLDSLPLLSETLISAFSLSCEAQEKPHGPRSVVMNIVERNIVYIVSDGEISIQSASLSKILENLTFAGAALYTLDTSSSSSSTSSSSSSASSCSPTQSQTSSTSATDSDMVLGTGFVNNFLLMYERFISHVDLLKFLRSSFEQTAPDFIPQDHSYSASLKEELLQNARSRRRAILEGFKRWMRQRYHDLRQDSVFVALLLDWLHSVQPMDDEEVYFFSSLERYFVRPKFHSVVAQEQALRDSSLVIGQIFDSSESSYLVLQKSFPREAAEQLCLIDFDIFTSLSPSDLLPSNQPAHAYQSNSPHSSKLKQHRYQQQHHHLHNHSGDLLREPPTPLRDRCDTPDCEPPDHTSNLVIASSMDADIASIALTPPATPGFVSSSSMHFTPRPGVRMAPITVSEPERPRTRITSRFNGISCWVAQTVLSFDQLEMRSLALQQLISLSWKCMRLNNFNTSFAILTGINSVPISRLKRSFATLNSKWRNRLRVLESLFDYRKSHKNYRAHLNTVQPPLVPFLGLVTKDIFAIDQNNPDTLDSGMVNFEKFSMIGRVIRETFQFQAMAYDNISPDPILQQFLLNIVSPKFGDPEYIEQLQETLYQTSMLLEPAGSTGLAPASIERTQPIRINKSPRRKHVIEGSKANTSASSLPPPFDVHQAALVSSSSAVRRHLTSRARSAAHSPESELSIFEEPLRTPRTSLSSSLIGSFKFGRKKSMPDIMSPFSLKMNDADASRLGDASTPRSSSIPPDDSNS